MKRRLAVLVVAAVLIAVGLAWRPWDPAAAGADAPGADASWLERAAALVGLGGGTKPAVYSGYVDADYVMVTSTVGGTLRRLDVTRGDRIEAGAALFALDDVAERAATEEAKARLAQAEAQLGDLLTGKRQPEIDAIMAQRAQAEASLRQSESDYRRQQQLRASGTSSTKQMEDARTQRDLDRRRIEELDAELEVARMPGREAAVQAADAAVQMARAALAQAQWRLDQKHGAAPAAALVFDTLYRPGEMVAAGMPVVQLLPPENLKIRFFVPETAVATLAVGQRIEARCDGCAAPIAATVRFVSPQAEFTPPVIYSRDERARLVFMVEARPTERLDMLRVGQPVDVVPVAP